MLVGQTGRQPKGAGVAFATEFQQLANGANSGAAPATGRLAGTMGVPDSPGGSMGGALVSHGVASGPFVPEALASGGVAEVGATSP